MEILNLVDSESRAMIHALFKLKEESGKMKVYSSNTRQLKETLNKEIFNMIDRMVLLNEFVCNLSKYDDDEIAYMINITELIDGEDGTEKD